MNTITRNSIYFCVLAITILSGCRKYVEIDTYTQRTLKYTADYQYLLNNVENFGTTHLLPSVTTDDIDGPSTVYSLWGAELQRAYIWSEQFYVDQQQDIGWNNLYKHIYVANEIIQGVMESQNGTPALKQQLLAEAKIHRAFAYLALANQYAPVYRPEEAANQPGLPLLLTPDLFQGLERVSLKALYDQIVADISSSIPHLPSQPSVNYHPAKAAAYALLSRTYLYMRNFEEAGRYADLALELKSELLNLDAIDKGETTFPRVLQDPEIILFKRAAGNFSPRLSDQLVALYDQEDLRLKSYIGFNANKAGYEYIRSRATNQGTYVGLNVPELYLNRAEVYARQGNLQALVDILNTFRASRFPEDHPLITADDVREDPLAFVIAERRREFVGTDLRWFDMRRLTLDEGYFKPVIREYNGNTYTLEANSPRLLYPIEQKVLDFNPEIGQNPR